MGRLAVALAMALMVSCSSADDPTGGRTTTSVRVTLPSPADGESGPPVSDEDEVEAALRAYWEMYFHVNDPPNPDDPAIAELSIGPARDDVLRVVTENHDNGTSYRLPDGSVTRHEIEIVSVAEDTAEFQDCWVDDGLVVQTDGGETVSGGTPITRLLFGTVVLEEGRWKVFEYQVLDEVDGVDGCAA